VSDSTIGVIGGGIIGLAVARRLLETRPGIGVTVLEKEGRLAAHQTGRSSGVIHAGVYYAPGSLKARLCRRGVGLMRAFCDRHGIPVESCGKVLVALDRDEQARLEALYERAVQNGVPGARLVSAGELKEIEPHVVGVAALHSPETAIVSFATVASALAAEIETLGGTVATRREVTGLAQRRDSVVVTTGVGDYAFDEVVICGGLHGDRLARLAGDGDDPRIVPFRGEYYLLRPERRDLVHGLVYPVAIADVMSSGGTPSRRFAGRAFAGWH
jgi:L-2-hydroxyglutarate oxidase LhgO